MHVSQAEKEALAAKQAEMEEQKLFVEETYASGYLHFSSLLCSYIFFPIIFLHFLV